MKRMDGKVAVVTGTSRGLGQALVAVLENEGARVTGASRSQGIDVTREDDVQRLFAGVMKTHGQIDMLINNAGVLTPRKSLVEVTKAEWDTSLNGNLTAVFLCMREAMRYMLPRRSGLIINVSSGVADRAAPTWGPYAAAKWGVIGLTKLAAAEAADRGVKVVAINPGRTRTPMRAEAYPDEDPGTVKTPRETALFYADVAAGEVPFESGDALAFPVG